MKKIVKLNEDDLKGIGSRVMSEQSGWLSYASLTPCKPGDTGTMAVQGGIMALIVNNRPFCRVEAKPVTGGGGSKPTPSGAAAGSKPLAPTPKPAGAAAGSKPVGM